MNFYKKYRQHDERDCGAACLATVFSYYGLKLPLAKCKELVKTNLQGTSIYGIVDGAQKKGLSADAYEGSFDELIEGLKSKSFSFPLIAHIIAEGGFEHFIVITSIIGNRIYAFDPAKGRKSYSVKEFSALWTGHIIAFGSTDKFLKGNYTKNYFRKFVSVIGRRKKTFIGVLLISLVIVVISLAGSMVYEQVIDNVILQGDTSYSDNNENYADTDSIDIGGLTKYEGAVNKIADLFGNLTNIKILFASLLILYFGQAALQIIRGIMLAHISRSVDKTLMEIYIEKVHKLPLNFFGNMRTGELLSRFTDIAEIRNAISNASLALVFDIAAFIGGALLMWMIDHTLFKLVIIAAGLYFVIFVIFKPIISNINNRIMNENAINVSNFKETADGIETIKLYNAAELSKGKLALSIDKLTKSAAKGQIIYTVQEALAYLMETISLLLTLWLGSVLVLRGTLSLGFLMTFSTLIGYVIMPIKEIIELQPTLLKAVTAADRLNDILEAEDELIFECDRDISLNGDIEIHDICFRYGHQDLTLDNMSLKIKKGEKVALTGESGCGKTTLAKLIMKINSPECGEIRFNGINISDISNDFLRSNVIYISQETFLFSDSIRNNLTMGDKSIEDTELESVCKTCMIYDFICHLPYGFDTVLDEGGKNLSGGQRQRFAIARALLKKPDILIMDEATSQLDGKTEQGIHNALFSTCKELTCLIIAHRLSTIVKCDKIAVMKDGKITEYGTHDELMSKNNEYAAMWNVYNT